MQSQEILQNNKKLFSFIWPLLEMSIALKFSEANLFNLFLTKIDYFYTV